MFVLSLSFRPKNDGGWTTASVFALRATPRQVAKMRDDRTYRPSFPSSSALQICAHNGHQAFGKSLHQYIYTVLILFVFFSSIIPRPSSLALRPSSIIPIPSSLSHRPSSHLLIFLSSQFLSLGLSPFSYPPFTFHLFPFP